MRRRHPAMLSLWHNRAMQADTKRVGLRFANTN
jgi:hypothetical protein